MNKRILAIDIAKKTGIATLINGKYFFDNFVFEKMTFYELTQNRYIVELLTNADVLLVEYQNDSFGQMGNTKTHFELQRKTHAIINLFSLINHDEGQVYFIRSREITPLIKPYAPELNLTKRKNKKEASLRGFNAKFPNTINATDDIADAYFFIQVYNKKVE